jgi:hypothetical protein
MGGVPKYKTLISPATAASQSPSSTITEAHPCTIVIYAESGLSASEYVDLQVTHDNGTTWQDVYQAGSQLRLLSTNNIMTIVSPGMFRVDKDLTTNATGVYLLY